MNEEYKPIYNLWKDSKGYRYFGTLKLSSKIKYDGDDFIPLWEWVNQLKQENKQLKEENAKLKLKPLQGIFAQVDDDMLLRNCGAMQQEVDNYKSILTELKEWLKETRINSAFIDEQTIMEVQLKIQELEQGSDSNE